MKPLLFIAAVLLCSCSAEERLLRLLARNPQLRDTVYVTDTVEAIVEHVRADTVWKVTSDTLVLTKDRLTVKTVVRRDTIWQQGECAPDTVTKVVRHEVAVVQPTKTITETKIPWWVPLVLMGLVATLVIVVIRKR